MITHGKTKRITIERTYDASIDEVWEMWTTKDGIEAWWGPDGFDVTVSELDVRPGGAMHYSMNARGAQQIELMKKEGMPVSHAVRGRFTIVTPKTRLAFMQTVDFVPNVAPFEIETEVQIHPAPNGVRLVLMLEAMQDEIWTQRMQQGWEMELGKLGKALEAEMKMDKIKTCLWFDTQAEEAAKLYTSLIEGSKITSTTPMVVDFELAGQRFMALNGGPMFRPTEACSIFVTCKDQAEVDRLWDKLIAGGGTPSKCGWLKDKFGVSWQIIPAAFMEMTAGESEKTKRMWAALMKMAKIDIAELKKAYDG